MLDLIPLILRALSLLWTLLVTALIGNVIALTVSAAGSATAAVNFCMFVAVLAWLATLLGLFTTVFSSFSYRGSIVAIAQFALDALALLFTFVAAVVLAAKLRAVNCANLDPKSLPEDYIAWGSLDNTKRCREIQASTVFLWFLFATLAGCVWFSFREWRSGRGGGSRSSGIGPSMRQVV
jgi:hypothetical protein